VFLAHQINSLVDFYDVTIIANFDGDIDMLDNISSKIDSIHVPIKRDINLLFDLKALFLLIIILHRNRFSLVHSVSPKAGLLTSIAAWITRVPCRLHTFTGQVWMTKKGLGRWFLKLLDKTIVMLNTTILVDSFSQQDFLVKEGILTRGFSKVLGSGSISGVDVNQFKPSNTDKKCIRRQLNIQNNCLLFLFVGRLKKEKGVFEAVEAFKQVSKQQKNVALIIVGKDEEMLRSQLVPTLGPCEAFIKFVDFTKTPEKYMAASDIFLMPSYREGFGSVIIEAASCGLPSIGSNIYGLSDAIVEGETGLLVPVKSSKLLEEAMLKLVNNKLRNTMGRNARNRAIHIFSQDKITSEILKLYKRLIK